MAITLVRKEGKNMKDGVLTVINLLLFMVAVMTVVILIYPTPNAEGYSKPNADDVMKPYLQRAKVLLRETDGCLDRSYWGTAIVLLANQLYEIENSR